MGLKRNKKPKKKPSLFHANTDDLREVLIEMGGNKNIRKLFNFPDNIIPSVKHRIYSDIYFYIKQRYVKSLTKSQIQYIFKTTKHVRNVWDLRLPDAYTAAYDPTLFLSPRTTRQQIENKQTQQAVDYTIPEVDKQYKESLKRMGCTTLIHDDVGNTRSLTSLRKQLSAVKHRAEPGSKSFERSFIELEVMDLMSNIIFHANYNIPHLILPSTFYGKIHKKMVLNVDGKREDFETIDPIRLPPPPLDYEYKIYNRRFKKVVREIQGDAFNQEIIIIPVTLYKHVSLLVIYPKQQIAQYHDPAEHKCETNDERVEVFWKILDTLCDRFLGTPATGWCLWSIVDKKGSIQVGPSDCVVVCLWIIELLLNRHPIRPKAFYEENMITYRKNILCDLAHGHFTWKRPFQCELSWPADHFTQGIKMERPKV